MKIKFEKAFSILLCLILSLCMISCGIFDDKDESADPGSETAQLPGEEEDIDIEDPTTKDYDNGIYFEEESEEARVRTVKTDPLKFIGKWEATSGQSLYQYGNVDITVKTNGTWKGNISDEELSGKWVPKGNGIYLSSDFFSFQLDYTDDDVLLMSFSPDEEDPDYIIRTVLTRK